MRKTHTFHSTSMMEQSMILRGLIREIERKMTIPVPWTHLQIDKLSPWNAKGVEMLSRQETA